MNDLTYRRNPGRALSPLEKRVLRIMATPVLAGLRRSRFFGLPRGMIHAEEAAARYAGESAGSWRRTLYEDPRPIARLDAGNAVPATAPVTSEVTILDSPRLSFRNNLVVGDEDVVVFPWTRDNYGRCHTFRDLRVWRARLERVQRVQGSVGYLSDTEVHNFAHWMLFVFPLVDLYREYLGCDPDYYYLGSSVQPWHYDSLAAIGIGRDRIVTDAVVADRMLAAIVDWPIPTPSRFLDFTTNTLRLPRGDGPQGRRVYISRRHQSHRRLLNEDVCIEVLKRHGFESHCTETLTLLEERELFAGAEIVVGARGAGLANLLFCHPGTVVVELFPHGFWGWFYEVAAARRLVYGCIESELVRQGGIHQTLQPLLIDPDKLDAVLVAASTSVESDHVGAATAMRAAGDR